MFGFSWKRALGITRVKTKISRAIGVPLTKSGRQRKVGAAVLGMFGVTKKKATKSRKKKEVLPE
jgi:hypothetical protein